MLTRPKGPAAERLPPVRKAGGGGTGWLRAAAIAGAAGVPISTHLYPEVGAQVMRVTETAHWPEWQDWSEDAVKAHLVEF